MPTQKQYIWISEASAKSWEPCPDHTLWGKPVMFQITCNSVQCDLNPFIFYGLKSHHKGISFRYWSICMSTHANTPYRCNPTWTMSDGHGFSYQPPYSTTMCFTGTLIWIYVPYREPFELIWDIPMEVLYFWQSYLFGCYHISQIIEIHKIGHFRHLQSSKTIF